VVIWRQRAILQRKTCRDYHGGFTAIQFQVTGNLQRFAGVTAAICIRSLGIIPHTKQPAKLPKFGVMMFIEEQNQWWRIPSKKKWWRAVLMLVVFTMGSMMTLAMLIKLSLRGN
jgi:hypothetical protein